MSAVDKSNYIITKTLFGDTIKLGPLSPRPTSLNTALLQVPARVYLPQTRTGISEMTYPPPHSVWEDDDHGFQKRTLKTTAQGFSNKIHSLFKNIIEATKKVIQLGSHIFPKSVGQIKDKQHTLPGVSA
jgi:hypothetical protein